MPRHPLKLEITLDKITSDSFGMVCIECKGRFSYFGIDSDGEIDTREKEYRASDLAFCKKLSALVRSQFGDRVGSLL